jgi:polysaccharide export outer membrane protein
MMPVFRDSAMSYQSVSARVCANRRTRRRVPALITTARRVGGLCVAVALPMMAAGCGTGVKGADRSEGWYQPEAIQEFVSETSSPTPNLTPEYVIGVNDLLDVVFLYHTNLSTRDLVVRRDGRISMPYVGDQMAAGITPMALDSILTTRFSEVLRDPNLSVIVKKPAPQRVYVLGQVRTPGRFEFDDELTAVQALAMAGGVDDGGMENHAVLIRRRGVSDIVGLEVDLRGVTNGSQLSNNLHLRNYDIVYVPKHPIYGAADFMEQIGDIINVPLDAVFKGWQIANLKENYQFYRTTAPTGQ